MDMFDKKREMVHMLMDMLKKNSADEVSGHPHMTDLSQTNDLQQKTSDSSRMADGGMALPSDEPNRLLEPKGKADGDNDALNLLPEMPQDEPAQQEERQTLHNENLEHEDEDNNQSSFQAFLKRRK